MAPISHTIRPSNQYLIPFLLHLKTQVLQRIFLKICLQIEYLGEILDVQKKLRRAWCYVPECDIRENLDTNECTNIFVSTKLHE